MVISINKLNILKTFKGGSLSSTKLIEHPKFGYCILKTVSTEQNREYGFVRFSSQIKRHNILKSYEPELFPEILEVGIDEFSKNAYAIYEYKKDFIPIIQFLLGKPNNQDIKKSVDNLINSLNKLNNHKLQRCNPQGSFDYYIKEEILYPIRKYKEIFDQVSLYFNDLEIKNTDQLENEVLNTFNLIKEDELKESCLIHGNSTLENILIHPVTLEIIYIDPYDETYIDLRASDLSQILQCSKYYYGIKMINKDFEPETQNFVFPNTSNEFAIFNSFVEKKIEKMSINSNLIKLLTTSQFTRLLPFRIKNGDLNNAKYFYALSYWIIKGN